MCCTAAALAFRGLMVAPIRNRPGCQLKSTQYKFNGHGKNNNACYLLKQALVRFLNELQLGAELLIAQRTGPLALASSATHPQSRWRWKLGQEIWHFSSIGMQDPESTIFRAFRSAIRAIEAASARAAFRQRPDISLFRQRINDQSATVDSTHGPAGIWHCARNNMCR